MKYFKAVPLRAIRPGNRREDPLTVNYGPRIMCNTYSRGEKKKKKKMGDPLKSVNVMTQRQISLPEYCY